MLGRLPHDPLQLARAPQLAPRLKGMTAPGMIARTAIAFTPGLDDNDTIGDCTAVALANCARAAAALHGDSLFRIPTFKVIAFYEQSTGYNPADPATDKGGVMALVLASQQRDGFYIEDRDIPLKGAWGTFDPADRNLMGVAIDVIGAVNLGVSLSISDQNMSVWDTETPASAGDPTPGSWGGHALMIWDYTGTADTDLVRLGTWGAWKQATWRWVAARAVEAHAIAWRRFGAAERGLDYDQLVADGALFTDV